MGFLFSQLKEIYKKCAIHKQVRRQASVDKILLDAQISEYNTKISTKPNACDTPQGKTNTIPIEARHLHSSQNNHPLKKSLKIIQIQKKFLQPNECYIIVTYKVALYLI